MSTITEELAQLHKLMTDGIITQEEFVELKKNAISKHTQSGDSKPAPYVPTQTVGGGGGGSTGGSEANPYAAALNLAPSSGGLVNVELFEESHTGAHLKAYGHLQAIVTNLLNHPDDPRFRRLRLENPKLQAELFSDPGSLPFLQSLGFELVEGATLGLQGDCLSLQKRPDLHLVESALSELDSLRQRDANAEGAARQYNQLRHSIALQLRREAWEKAENVGEIEQFATTQFVLEPPKTGDDELEITFSSIITLRKVLENIHRDPSNVRYRTLRLGNSNVLKLIHGPGTLEFLCGVCKFVFSDDGLTLPMNVELRLDAVDLLEQIQLTAEQHRQDYRQRQRDEARQAILCEKKSERKEMGDAGKSSLELAKEEEARKKAAEERANAPRVKITDALLHLLGKSEEERKKEKEESSEAA